MNKANMKNYISENEDDVVQTIRRYVHPKKVLRNLLGQDKLRSDFLVFLGPCFFICRCWSGFVVCLLVLLCSFFIIGAILLFCNWSRFSVFYMEFGLIPIFVCISFFLIIFFYIMTYMI